MTACARSHRCVLISTLECSARCRAGSNTTTFTLGSDADASEALLEQGELTSAGLDGAPTTTQAPDASAMAMARPAAAAAGEDAPVSYNYSFFHLVFALASTYIAMLMTGWGEGSEQRALLDIGWASVAMKLLTQWATGLLYIWVLVAPSVLQARRFA
jgi:serine incorporator 1/3